MKNEQAPQGRRRWFQDGSEDQNALRALHSNFWARVKGGESFLTDYKIANIAEKRRYNYHNYDFMNCEIGRSYGKVFSFLHDGQAMMVLDTFVSLVDYVDGKFSINDMRETDWPSQGKGWVYFRMRIEYSESSNVGRKIFSAVRAFLIKKTL